jgi:hypothetical protein
MASETCITSNVDEDDFHESPRKRLRPSRSRNGSIFNPDSKLSRNTPSEMGDEEHVHEGREESITIASATKLAGQTVAPFLAKHIQDRYAPLGISQAMASEKRAANSSKYCYRHRPDLKCRRQADEPSMDQLQRVGRTAPLSRLTLTLVIRNSRHYLKVTNRALLTFGHCSRPLRQSTVTLFYKEYLLNAAFLSCPSSRRTSES